MSKHLAALPTQQVIYEVNACITVERRDEYLEWLSPHIDQMLAIPGFLQARLLNPEQADRQNRFCCTVHYVLDSMDSLQRYFDEHAETLRRSGSDRFGDDLEVSRRVLATTALYSGETSRHDHEHGIASLATGPFSNEDHAVGLPSGTCLNCGTALNGQYCYVCGQRSQRKLVSVVELVGDLIRDLASWDSRFWRTLWPLMFKPGFLTNAYLKGQRTRYSPPLRMYLIASLLFFLIATLQPQLALKSLDVDAPLDTSDLQISFDPPNDSTDAPIITMGERDTPAPVISPNDPDQPVEPPLPEASGDTPDSRANAEVQCAKIRAIDSPVFQQYFGKRAEHSCLRLTTRAGLRDFGLGLLDNLPGTLLILLPLIALVNKLIYALSRRYYVEHLLFYVHGFSFVFLFTTFLVILAGVAKWNSFDNFGWIIALSVLYVIYYFLASMRVVYRQSRTLTFLKWCIVMVSFGFLSLIIFGGFALLTAAFL